MDIFQPATEDLDMTTVLQALGDPVRLRIVRLLASEGEQVCGAVDLGISKSTRSHHFKTLREAGVTFTRIEGTHRHVSLRRDDLEARFPGLLDAVLQTQGNAGPGGQVPLRVFAQGAKPAAGRNLRS